MSECRIYPEWTLADFERLLRHGAFMAGGEEKIDFMGCFEFVVGLCFSCFHGYIDPFIGTSYDRRVYSGAGKLGDDSLQSGRACECSSQCPGVIGKISSAGFVDRGGSKFVALTRGGVCQLTTFVWLRCDNRFICVRMSYKGHSIFLEIDWFDNMHIKTKKPGKKLGSFVFIGGPDGIRVRGA